MAPKRQRKRQHERNAQPVASIISLGCPKNLVDSEKLLAGFADAGYALSLEIEGADVVVVNTCGFLASARAESLEVIDELAQLKRERRLGRILVAGCMPMLAPEEILAAAPEVDAVLGVNDRPRVAALARQWRSEGEAPGEAAGDSGDEILTSGKTRVTSYADFRRGQAAAGAAPVVDDLDRVRLTASHTAFLRIAEGCSQGCNYCTIPRIRGPFRSKPAELILDEARQLVDDGAVELNVIAQDTTAWGGDLGGGASLAGLLEQLSELPRLRWLRVMYAYPTGVDERFIETLADCDKVVKYLDMPLQHIDDGVLKAMGRRIDGRATRALLDRLRDRVEGLVLRTTFIVGHPGESDEAFDSLHAFVKNFEFEAMGAFAYSAEAGTPSAKLPDAVAPEVAAARLEALMLTQQEIAFAANATAVGSRVELLVDGADARGVAVGRHYGQAPEIDSVCLLTEPVEPGRFIAGEIVDSEDYDLVVRPLQTDAKSGRRGRRR